MRTELSTKTSISGRLRIDGIDFNVTKIGRTKKGTKYVTVEMRDTDGKPQAITLMVGDTLAAVVHTDVSPL